MNFLQYELFASVARTLNLSKTAQQYNISQPAVSHQLKSLEDSLGLELVRRTKRGVVLTEAGQELLPYVQQILAINNQAENRMQNMAGGTVGHIRIAALSSASFQVSDCLVALFANHPNIQADISLLEGTELMEALRENSHDFYFGVSPMTPDNMGYESAVIARGRLELFVNRSVAGRIDLDNWNTVARLPFVSVPVLSKTTVFTSVRSSRILPPLIRMPQADAPPIPPKKASGTETTSAHGQEMTRKISALRIHTAHWPSNSGGRRPSSTAPTTTMGV